MDSKHTRVLTRTVAIAAFGLLVNVVAVRAADTIRVYFANGATTDLNVTVYDINSGQADPPLLKSERINVGKREEKDIVADGSGKGSVKWTSQFTDGTCKSGSATPSNEDEVAVGDGDGC